MKQCTLALLAATCLTVNVAHAQLQDWRSQMDRGNELRRAGKYTEACSAYRESVRTVEQSGSDPLHLASSLNSLAMIEDELGLLMESEQHYRRALATVEKVAGTRSVSRAQVLVNLSGIYVKQGHSAKAEEMLREAIAILNYFARPENETLLALAQSCLAETVLHRGEYAESESLLTSSIPVLEKEPEPREGYFGMSLNNLGVVRRYQHRNDEAVTLFERSIAILETDRGPDSAILLYPLNNLAMLKAQAGLYTDATAHLHRALVIAEAQLGKDHPTYGTVLMNYAICLKKDGRKAEAKNLEALAQAVLKDSARRNGTGMTVDIAAFRQK